MLALVAGLALLLLIKPWGDEERGAFQQPNILLIVADDLGNNDLGLFGDGSASTPNIDALARGGARFRRHYANATCRPSRMALLTGMSSSRVAVPPHIWGISPERVTLPEALSAAGYATEHIGKWHLGYQSVLARPEHQGFDRWYGFLSATLTRNGTLTQPGKSYLNPWLQGSDVPLARQQGHLTELLTEHAIASVERLAAGDQPWFLNLWYFAPHAPVQPAAEFRARFPDTPEGRYLALVAQLDHSIGRLLTALADTGELDNTLVVFLSDNGATNRSRDSNKPYYGKKNTFTEGGMRTPLILSLPGSIAAADIHEPVFISDVMPSLLDWAGVEIPSGVSGLSVLPLLDGAMMRRASRYFWDIEVDRGGKYGMLDLQTGTLTNGLAQQLWLPSQQRFGDPQALGPEQIRQVAQAYARWSAGTRRVELRAAVTGARSNRYDGDSFRRTPGVGGWSLQVPVQLDAREKLSIVQPQQLLLELEDGKLRVELPGVAFATELESGGCQLLTLSSYYNWHQRAERPSPVYVALYLGEQRLHEAQYTLDIDVLVDRFEPTDFSFAGTGPVISNDYLSSDLLAHYRDATGVDPGCDVAREVVANSAEIDNG